MKAKAVLSTTWHCQDCHRIHKKPTERCICGSWKIVAVDRASSIQKHGARSIAQVDERDAARIDTYDAELNRVLGGGIVLGSQIAISGEPAAGKSTLLTQVSLEIAEGDPVLYVCGEETPAQVKGRALRLVRGSSIDWSKVEQNLILTETTNILGLEKEIADTSPVLVIVDSIASMQGERDVAGGAKVLDAAEHLVRISKKTNVPLVIVAHVTKDSVMAGPRAFEHLVDVALHLEGDRREQHRFLRAFKNRFGATDEVGLYEMTANGLRSAKIGVDLADRTIPQTSCLTLVSEGSRFFVHEIQAAVGGMVGKVHARGLRGDRVAMLAALLRNQLSLMLQEELFLSCVGGGRVDDPLADMAICAAILSSHLRKVLPCSWLCLGELSPTGFFSGSGISKRVAFLRQHFEQTIEAKTPKDTPSLQALFDQISAL